MQCAVKSQSIVIGCIKGNFLPHLNPIPFRSGSKSTDVVKELWAKPHLWENKILMNCNAKAERKYDD